MFSDAREAESRAGCLILKGTQASQESFNRRLVGEGEVLKGAREDGGESRHVQSAGDSVHGCGRCEGGVSLAFRGLP